MKVVTLYLIGFAGSGKYTIAKEFEKLGYKILDNHLINNPIFSLLDLKSGASIPDTAWDSISEIRKAILGFISQDTLSNYVFTNELLEETACHQIYNEVKSANEIRGGIFIPIKLILSAKENRERIKSPGRIEKFKKVNITESDLQKELIKISHPNLAEIDITNLSALDASKEILLHVEKVLSSSHDLASESIIVEESENPKVRSLIRQGVINYNIPYLGEWEPIPFIVCIKDENSKIVAGIVGDYVQAYLRVNYAWVSENYRKKGYGSKVFKILDAFAISKDCKYIQLETMDFQAKPFYEKLGFKLIATLPDWYNSYSLHILRKDIAKTL